MLHSTNPKQINVVNKSQHIVWGMYVWESVCMQMYDPLCIKQWKQQAHLQTNLTTKSVMEGGILSSEMESVSNQNQLQVSNCRTCKCVD